MIFLTVKRNFRYIIRFEIIITQTLLFFLTYIIFLYNLSYVENVHLKNIETYFFSAYIPGYNYSYFEIIIFLLPLFGLFFVYGIIHNIELNKNKYYIFSRFKNLKQWSIGNLLFNILYSSTFVLVSVLVLFILNYFISSGDSISFKDYINLEIKLMEFFSLENSFIFLLTLKVFILSILLNFQFLVNILFKKVYIGYITNFALSILCISIVNPKYTLFFPINYLIISRFNNFLSLYSLVYIFFIYITSIILIYYSVLKKGLFT